ncbi:tRNA (adenosine(37)-N6)-threonylcarbamoyltransferase complex dimerization subunit type 1 TsaB [uncultured Roseobacter sp.]|uniref:tRNA (adenosine(37)-N6)-threonylcarbamoyltransferase complex dimerization subunit type 1 TsaB n=1 Tax=uncultured Roseobacter sp. TaxID=114847 RepID=UPI00262CD381|nr:tRNA (adenosine(37)-N6)-threonylcarbamoyltransferase complex dimerization subunit type 1 TsaB [uncultured Roseobacter sp.]
MTQSVVQPASGDQPLVLAFDTSAARVAVCVLHGQNVLAQAEEEMAKGQAERLMGLCQETLKSAGAATSDISLIATGTGPGNFTGIRISVSAARGLALGLDVPAIGINNLEAQAFGIQGTVFSSLDARRDALYLQVLQNAEPVGAPVLCDLESLPEVPAGVPPLCTGHRSEETAARIGGQSVHQKLPVAETIARCARARRHLQNPRPAPVYIRPADAAPAKHAAPVILP